MNSIETGKYFNPKYSYQIKATKHGFIQYISTKAVGMVAFNLGAGRVTKESNIDYHAGIYLNKVTNEFAKKGDTIATLYSSKPINKTIIEDFIKNTKFNLKKIKTRPIIAKVMK
jgi:thymidine phosphorylase